MWETAIKRISKEEVSIHMIIISDTLPTCDNESFLSIAENELNLKVNFFTRKFLLIQWVLLRQRKEKENCDLKGWNSSSVYVYKSLKVQRVLLQSNLIVL